MTEITTEFTGNKGEYDPIIIDIGLYNGETITMNSGDHNHYYNNDTNHTSRRARVIVREIHRVIELHRGMIDFDHPRCQEMKDCFDTWVRENIEMELEWIKLHKNKSSAFVVGRSGYSPSRNDGAGIKPLSKKIGIHNRKYVRDINKITKTKGKRNEKVS